MAVQDAQPDVTQSIDQLTAAVGGVGGAIAQGVGQQQADSGTLFNMIYPVVLEHLAGIRGNTAQGSGAEVEQATAVTRIADAIAALTDLNAETLRALITDTLAQLSADLGPVLAGIMGRAPDVGEPEGATVGGSMAQGQLRAVTDYLARTAHSDPRLDGDMASAFGLVDEKSEPLQERFNVSESKLTQFVREQLALDAPADPDTVLDRAMSALGRAAAMGIAAHITSAILSIKVFGSFGLESTGIAAMIAEFAGFGPILGALRNTYLQRAIGVPWGYKVNEMLRPWMPSVGDLLRMRGKGILGAKDAFDKFMARWGFSDFWIANYEDDLYREPSLREIQQMSEDSPVDDRWLRAKLKRLTFSEDDLDKMVPAFKRRMMRSEIRGVAYAAVQKYRYGFGGPDEARAELESLGYPPDWADLWIRRATLEYQVEHGRDLADWALTAYSRDQLTDEQLGALLTVAYGGTETGILECKKARLKRYRTVYRLTDSERAAGKLGLYRRAFVEGEITAADYERVLRLAGTDDDAVGLILSLDGDARNEALLGELRRFDLPAWRDKVLHGFAPVEQYAKWLFGSGLPVEFIAGELELVKAKLEIRKQAVVRSDFLPAVRRAFVLGLIGGREIRLWLGRAGIEAGAIDGQVAVLEEDARGQRARLQKAIGAGVLRAQRQAAAAIETERKQTANALAVADRDRKRAEQAEHELAEFKQRDALERVRAAADRLITEARKGERAKAERVDELALAFEEELFYFALPEAPPQSPA